MPTLMQIRDELLELLHRLVAAGDPAAGAAARLADAIRRSVREQDWDAPAPPELVEAFARFRDIAAVTPEAPDYVSPVAEVEAMASYLMRTSGVSSLFELPPSARRQFATAIGDASGLKSVDVDLDGEGLAPDSQRSNR